MWLLHPCHKRKLILLIDSGMCGETVGVCNKCEELHAALFAGTLPHACMPPSFTHACMHALLHTSMEGTAGGSVLCHDAWPREQPEQLVHIVAREVLHRSTLNNAACLQTHPLNV